MLPTITKNSIDVLLCMLRVYNLSLHRQSKVYHKYMYVGSVIVSGVFRCPSSPPRCSKLLHKISMEELNISVIICFAFFFFATSAAFLVIVCILVI